MARAERHGLRLIVAFGSRATGRSHPGSDLDNLVRLRPLAEELGGTAPRDFFESFLRMVELNVLPPDFARQIAHAAGLRNRLAHEYNDIDPRLVHTAARQALVDIPSYLDHLQRFLETV
jgi:uncharacterized protein YutE (UPF0331/DUF86 family)